jgi:hypothetical protein
VIGSGQFDRLPDRGRVRIIGSEASTMIQPMSAALRGYIHAFDLHTVCQYSDGRIAVSGNQADAVAAWWCEGKRDAGFVAKLATQGRMSIPDAAQQLHIRIAPHAHVVARAEEAIGRLNASLARANGDGTLQAFNRQYRARREAAHSMGQGFMTYAAARNRLIRLLAQHAAGTVPSSVFAKVFTSR